MDPTAAATIIRQPPTVSDPDIEVLHCADDDSRADLLLLAVLDENETSRDVTLSLTSEQAQATADILGTPG